jgi:hypothetical protein
MPMLTYTDRVVLPTIASPSLVDIAVSLSRQPRFGGHTRRWWSVLDHTLFCDELVQEETDHRFPRLALLLHDAHEAITADVPTDAKTTGLKLLQADLDVAIMDAFFPDGLTGYNRWRDTVKRIDRVALVAEGIVLGPPVEEDRLVAVDPIFDRNLTGVERAMMLLEQLLEDGTVGHTPWVDSQEAHPAVEDYLARMNYLL